MSRPEVTNARTCSSTDEPIKYEYLDHTADVQIHAWGPSVENAIEQCVNAMYAYMTTDPATIEPVYSMDFRASGSDMCSLVYNLLDTCLYHFSTEPFFIGRTCRVLSLSRGDSVAPRRKHNPSDGICNHRPIGEGDKSDNSAGGGIEGEEYSEEDALKLDGYNIHIRAFGESFDTEKHPPGTEIKAITYSNLRVIEPVSDKTKRRRQDSAEADENAAKLCGDKIYERHENEFNIFVIVDI